MDSCGMPHCVKLPSLVICFKCRHKVAKSVFDNWVLRRLLENGKDAVNRSMDRTA